MRNRRFAGIFAAIFIIGALPLILAQPSGVASAGLGTGFMSALASPLYLAFYLATGFCSTLLRRESAMMLPVTFLLMMLIGAALLIDAEQYPSMRLFIFVSILLYALAVGIAYTKPFLMAAAITSSVAFQMGMHFMETIPAFAPSLHYLLGVMTGVALIVAIGVSLGIALHDNTSQWLQKVKQSPAATLFFSLFC